MDVDKYGGGTVASSISTHGCPYCTLTYGSLAGVAAHLVRKHAGEPIPTETTLLHDSLNKREVKQLPDWMAHLLELEADDHA